MDKVKVTGRDREMAKDKEMVMGRMDKALVRDNRKARGRDKEMETDKTIKAKEISRADSKIRDKGKLRDNHRDSRDKTKISKAKGRTAIREMEITKMEITETTKTKMDWKQEL